MKRYRGKVADEPDCWIEGELIGNNQIYQNYEPEKGCCGVGIFTIIPNTLEYIEEE